MSRAANISLGDLVVNMGLRWRPTYPLSPPLFWDHDIRNSGRAQHRSCENLPCHATTIPMRTGFVCAVKRGDLRPHRFPAVIVRRRARPGQCVAISRWRACDVATRATRRCQAPCGKIKAASSCSARRSSRRTRTSGASYPPSGLVGRGRPYRRCQSACAQVQSPGPPSLWRLSRVRPGLSPAPGSPPAPRKAPTPLECPQSTRGRASSRLRAATRRFSRRGCANFLIATGAAPICERQSWQTAWGKRNSDPWHRVPTAVT